MRGPGSPLAPSRAPKGRRRGAHERHVCVRLPNSCLLQWRAYNFLACRLACMTLFLSGRLGGKAHETGPTCHALFGPSGRTQMSVVRLARLCAPCLSSSQAGRGAQGNLEVGWKGFIEVCGGRAWARWAKQGEGRCRRRRGEEAIPPTLASSARGLLLAGARQRSARGRMKRGFLAPFWGHAGCASPAPDRIEELSAGGSLQLAPMWGGQAAPPPRRFEGRSRASCSR